MIDYQSEITDCEAKNQSQIEIIKNPNWFIDLERWECENVTTKYGENKTLIQLSKERK